MKLRLLVTLLPALLAFECDPEKNDDDSGDEPEILLDLDGDGYTEDVDCDDNDPFVHPGASETCDLVDNDCDGAIDAADDDLQADTLFPDEDGDGFGADGDGIIACPKDGLVPEAGDCDDDDAKINPDAEETCDDLDNDCDGNTDDDDDGVTGLLDWYEDADEDRYGDEDSKVSACKQPPGYVSIIGDCDDDDKAVNPDAEEDCSSGIDNDCNGLTACEDGACASDDICIESCLDLLDNDMDGYTDCDDDDCWPNIDCVTSAVTVVTGGGGVWDRFSSAGYRRARLEVYSVSGEVRFYGAQGTETCTWTRDSGTWGYSYGEASSTYSYGDVPVLSSGCTFGSVQVTQWHPQELFMAAGSPVAETYSEVPFVRLNGTPAVYGGAFGGYWSSYLATSSVDGSPYTWSP